MAAGAEIVCGVDAWEIATKTYKSNFPDASAITLKLSNKSGVTDLGKLGSIDMILASPECTNHTCAKGAAPRNEQSKLTARYVLRFAKDLKPRWVVVENVVHMRSWVGYSPLIKGLKRLGYHVRPQVLDASDFGVPQSRRRLFLLCDLNREPSGVPTGRRAPNAHDAVIQWDGPWRSRPLNAPKRALGTLERAERAMAALGAGTPFLIVYYGSDGSGGWQPLDRPLRTLTTLDRFGLVTWEDDTPMLRMLQVPELKRAMGFTPEFELSHGSRRDKVRLMGNGVCPPVMEALVRSLTGQVSNALAVERGATQNAAAFSLPRVRVVAA